MREKMNISDFSILIASNATEKTSEIQAGLKSANVNTMRFEKTAELVENKNACEPFDIVLLYMSSEEQDNIASLLPFIKLNCPIILFIDKVGRITLSEMIDAGITSVIVDGLKANRIEPIIETTMKRFKKIHGLQIQLDQALLELEERKIIDRAKGLLMIKKNISEAEAYKLLRTTAMNRNCKIIDIAKTIIIVDEI